MSNESFILSQNENTLLQCNTCFCVVSPRDEGVCRSCLRQPLPNNGIEYCDDFVTCHGCEVILCPFHSAEINLENELCNRCLTGCLSDNDSDNDDDEVEENDEELNNTLQVSFNDAPPAKRQKLTVETKVPYVKIEMNEVDVNCSICMDILKGEAAQLSCHSSHMFHIACINTWLYEHSSSCPICQCVFNK